MLGGSGRFTTFMAPVLLMMTCMGKYLYFIGLDSVGREKGELVVHCVRGRMHTKVYLFG